MITALLAACTLDLSSDTVPISTLQADFEWQLQVDQAGLDAGYTECTYHRHYTGEEDLSVPWLCPECDEIWRSTVAMPPADLACFDQINAAPPAPLEWLGIGDDTW